MAQKKKKKVTRKRPPTQRVPKKVVENIQRVGGVTAEKLRKAGFGTIAKLSQADPGRLAEKTGFNKPLANKLVSAARNIYKEASAEQPPAEKRAAIEEGQTIKGKIITAAMKNEEFRRRVVYYIVGNMF